MGGASMSVMRTDFLLTVASFVQFLCRKAGVSSMNPYSVLLRGEPLWWLGPDGLIEEIGGFYTERLVMASSPEDAAARALRIVTREVHGFAHNPSGSPVRIEVENCRKLIGFISSHGRGFTFWPKAPG
jgi:hypothetical protein